MTLHKNYIAGEWVEGKDQRDNINPSDVSEVIGHYAQADAAQAQRDLEARKTTGKLILEIGSYGV